MARSSAMAPERMDRIGRRLVPAAIRIRWRYTAAGRVHDRMGWPPADDPARRPEHDALVIAFKDSILPDSVTVSVIVLFNDAVHGNIAQLTGKIAGIGRA